MLQKAIVSNGFFSSQRSCLPSKRKFESTKLMSDRFCSGLASLNSCGKLLENRFSKEVFGFTPADDDTDARYLLYKQLSGLERQSILAISNAIYRSRI